MKFKWFIGIDVSKKTFDVVLKIDPKATHYVYENTKSGIKQFIRELKHNNIVLDEGLICMEHTGLYTHLLLELLHCQKANIWLEQALNIKRSLGIQRGKNDQVDSLRIAEYAFRFTDKCQLWSPPRPIINHLRSLIALRERLVKSKKMLQVPLQELRNTDPTVYKQIKKYNQPVIEQLIQQQLLVEQ